MKTFDELYEMYKNGDDDIFFELDCLATDIDDLVRECRKDMTKYYGFEQFLYNMLEY